MSAWTCDQLIAHLQTVRDTHGTDTPVLVACTGPGPTSVGEVTVGDSWDGDVCVVVHDGRWEA